MITIRNKKTGETKTIDESEMGQYGLGDNGAGGTAPAGEDDLVRLYMQGAFGAPGSTEAGRYLTQLDKLGLMGGEEEEEDDIMTNLERRMDVLEGLWFPYEDQLAMPKAGNKIQRITHKFQKQFEASSEYELFSRQAKTMGATLAKAAGDTGNIAWAEQAAQLQALADSDLTKEEAAAAFSNIRQSLGFEKKGAGYYDSLRAGETPVEEGRVLDQGPRPPTGEPVSPYDPSQPGSGLTKLLAKAQEVGGETQALPALFGLLGGLSPLRAAGTGLGTMHGQRSKQMLQKRAGGAGLLETLIPTGQETGEVLKKGATTGALDLLLRPLSNLGALRGTLGGGGVSGEKVAQAGVEFAEKAPVSQMQRAGKLALQGIEKFGGKNLGAQEALAQKSLAGRAGYTAAGAGRGATAGFERAIEEALRKQLFAGSTGIKALTKLMSGVMKAKSLGGRVTGSLGQSITQGIGGGLTFAGLKRLGLLD